MTSSTYPSRSRTPRRSPRRSTARCIHAFRLALGTRSLSCPRAKLQSAGASAILPRMPCCSGSSSPTRTQHNQQRMVQCCSCASWPAQGMRRRRGRQAIQPGGSVSVCRALLHPYSSSSTRRTRPNLRRRSPQGMVFDCMFDPGIMPCTAHRQAMESQPPSACAAELRHHRSWNTAWRPSFPNRREHSR